MPLRTGTLAVSDLLGNSQGIEQLDQQAVADAFRTDLAVHNRLVDEMVGEFAETTRDRQRRYGAAGRGEMRRMDEFGRMPTQKVAAGQTVGFPLELWAYAVGFTRKYLEQAPANEVAIQFQAAQTAHRIAVQQEIQRAVYLSANYTFFDDLVAPNIDIAVKRFANADGMPLPTGPNGESFDGATHTHYLANAGLTAGALTSLVNTVVEHGIPAGGQVRLAINRTNQAAVEGLAGFVAYPQPGLVPVAGQPTQTRVPDRLDNVAIGRFAGAEVWVRPWALAGRALAYVANGGGERPLVMRTRNGTSNLAIAAEIDLYPLRADYMEAEFGVGVWNRTAGAVLDFVNATYTDPAI